MMKLKAEEDSVRTDTDEIENMYLNFDVGSEVYGIEIRHVLQIIGMMETIEMPNMPPGARDLTGLRISMIAVDGTSIYADVPGMFDGPM